MRRIVWSDEALRDFERAIGFIAAENPVAAGIVADRIDEAVRGLSALATGHPGRVENTFEKLVPRTPYILAYALTEEELTVLHVIQGRRNWPTGEWARNVISDQRLGAFHAARR